MTHRQSSSVSLGDWADSQEWVDITVPIRDQMVHYPGDPGVELRVTKHLDRGDPATVSHLSLGVHTGTHVDAPVHFIAGAPGVERTSIESMNGPARVIEIANKETCTAQDLAPFDISSGERVLLRTSNSTRCWNVDTFVEDYAHLDVSAAKFLTERRIRMIGIDYLSIGRGEEGPEVHRILLGAGIVILEGLDLSKTDPGPYDLLCLPLKILGCDGAPARVALRRRNGGSRGDRPRVLGQTIRAAVVVPREKTVRLIERSAPGRPKGSQVLLRILEVGICGTDREISAFKYGTPPEGQTELVLGHEAVAEVIAAGPDATWVRPGDLVVPTVRRPCSNARCAPCRDERQDFCLTGEFSERGIARADGFLCDGVLEDERFLVRVPGAIQDVAVLVEPLSVVAKAITEFETIHTRFAFDLPRMRALVLGAGPVGLLAAMALQADGFDTTVFSLAEEDSPQAELVRSFGANYVSSKRTPVEHISERIGMVDVIFEAVGVPQVAFGALPNLAANGVFILTGIPAARDPVPADLSRWMLDVVLKNQVLFGTVNAGHRDYEDAVRRLEQFMGLFPEVVRSLIGRIPFDQAPEALSHRLGIKDVITLAA